MSLSNSISLIADKYYTIEEDGKLIDLRSLIGSSTTILNQEILDRKADKNDVAYTLNSKLNISTYENFKNDLLPVTLNSKLNITDYTISNNSLITNMNNTFATKLTTSTFNNFKNNLLPVTLNSKLDIDDFNNTNLANLKIIDFNNTNLSNLKIDAFNQTNLANLKIIDFNNTNSSNLRIADFNQTNLANLKIIDFNNTNLNNLKIDDFNNTVNSILFTTNSKVSITEFTHFQNTTNTKLNEKVNITDYSNTHTSIINNINSRVLTTDYDTYKAATAITLGEKVNILDYNTNNILLGTQIASKLSSSTFNLFQIENTNNLNSKLDKTTYNTTNQSVLDQINLRQGVFTPLPPLYFQLNIEGPPIMNLVLSENEVTTLSNFHNKTDISSLFLNNSNTFNTSLSLYDTTITVNSKISTVNDSINLRVSQTTLTSTLSNYLGFNLTRSSALVKSVDVSNYDYLKFETDKPLLILDRTNYWGYSTNTIITNNLASSRNIYCYQNLYLRNNSLIYTNDLETEFINITELSYLKNISSNLQTQVNNKAPLNNPTFTGTVAGITKTMVDLSNVDNTSDVNKPISTATQTALNNKVDSSALTNYDTASTINSKLSNYLGFDTLKSNSVEKIINMNNYDYIRFESDLPIMSIDKSNYYGYTARTVLVNNFVSNKNIYCFSNLYLRSNSLIYTNETETQFINTTELSYLKNSTSNLQTQINNKIDSISLNNYDTSTTVTSKINTLSTNLANNVNSNDISCNSNLYFNQAAVIYTSNSRSQYVTPFDLYCCFGSSSNLQNQITNNLSSLTTSINLRISQATLSSTLTSYDTSITINSKLLYTAKYDMVRGNTDDKVINLSGSSSLSFDTYNISDAIYKKDLFYDISNASSYTRNTVFSRYLRANNLWVEGTLRLNNSSIVLDNPVNSKTITATELYNLNGVSSNIQTQLNNKQTKFVYAARIFNNGTVDINCGQYSINNANITNSSAGNFVFTLPTPHPNGAAYFIMANPSPSSSGMPYFISTYVNSSTSFVVYTYNSSGTAASQPFMYHTIP